MLNEITILKQMDHPNILKLYEFFQDDKRYFLVTELVPSAFFNPLCLDYATEENCLIRYQRSNTSQRETQQTS